MASRAVFCIVPGYTQALKVVDDLRAGGFANEDISVLLPDKTGTRDFAHEHHTKAPEGAAVGAGTGPPTANAFNCVSKSASPFAPLPEED